MFISQMSLKPRHGSLLAWLILLVAGLGPVHAFIDELTESCPIAFLECSGDPEQHDGDVSESDGCHEHCAIAGSISPTRPGSISVPVIEASLDSSIFEFLFMGNPGTNTVAPATPILGCDSASAYHQRVGLRLYA